MTSNLPGEGVGWPEAMPPSPQPIDQDLPVDNNQGQVQRTPINGYTPPAASPARGPVRAKPTADLGTPFNSGKTCPSVTPRTGGNTQGGF